MRSALPYPVVALLLGAAGCAHHPPIVPPPPHHDPVTPEAVAAFEDARALFARHEAEGWSPEACEQTVHAFEALDTDGVGQAAARTMVGVVHQRCGDRESARASFEAALAVEPKYCQARSGLAGLDLSAGAVDSAVATFERAIRDDPRCAEAYIGLGAVQRRRGQHEVALDNLRRGLAIDSRNVAALNQVALLHMQVAEHTGERSRLDLAEVVCRQAQLIDRTYAPIYNTWGLVKVRQGEVIDALRLFERARELDPRMVEAHLNFGSITLSFRGYEDSRGAFARAAELRPRSYDAQIGLGASLRGLGRLDEAEQAYERARGIDPARPEADFNLGVLYQDYLGPREEHPEPALRRARAYYQEFLERAGERPAYRDTVAEVQRHCGDTRRTRRRSACRPGRLELIDTTLEALAPTHP